MNSSNISIFFILFGFIILAINGVKLSCNRFFRRGQCTLFIDANQDRFFVIFLGKVPQIVYQDLFSLNNRRLRNPRMNKNLLGQMSNCASNRIDARTVIQICKFYGKQCGLKTKIKFIGTPSSFKRRNSSNGSIISRTSTIRRGSIGSRGSRGSVSSRGSGGSRRGSERGLRRGYRQSSLTVSQRRRNVFANEREDED
uniref:Uncharacterized protein n=1 Tax=Strongyloides stercoralis TaxID=6248 RepID=A0A0K0ENC0_STRER